MIEWDYDVLFLKNKYIFFPDKIYDINGYDNVIFHHYNNKVKVNNYKQIESLTCIIDLTQSYDQLWKNLKPKTRQKINKAKNQGIEVKINTDYNKFHKIYNNFIREKGIDLPLKNDVPSLKFIKNNGFLITSYYNDALLGGIVAFMDRDNSFIYKMASKRLTSDKEHESIFQYQNFLLVWETIQYLKNLGIDTWDWGGLWAKNVIDSDPSKIGSNQFKLGYGAKEKISYNYIKTSKIYEACVNGLPYFVSFKNHARANSIRVI